VGWWFHGVASPPGLSALLASAAAYAAVKLAGAGYLLYCSDWSSGGLSAPLPPETHQIRSLVFRVDLVGSRRIWPAHVGCLVDLDGSRTVPSDRLDDQTDDQAVGRGTLGYSEHCGHCGPGTKYSIWCRLVDRHLD
jgi:hypothetical protein